MQPFLCRFISRLRHRGLDISPGEHLDALAAVQQVPWEDRVAFREALRAALVKWPEHNALFEAEFARFFSTPELPKPDRGKKPGAGGGRLSGRGRAVGLSDEISRRGQSQTRPEGARPASRPGGTRASELRGGRGRPITDETEQAAGGRVTFRGARPPESERSVQELRRAELQSLTPAQVHELRAHVRRMARRIATRLARRRRPASRGPVDLKRTARKALQFGGVPFILARKARRVARSEIVILCDVSGSVLRAADLTLEFLRALSEVPGDLRVFAYTNRAREITQELAHAGGDLSAACARAGVDLHAFSDFGHACYHLTQSHPNLCGPKTTLVIIGDARNNYADPLTWAFEEFSHRCRRVIGLAPEPKERWNTADSQIAQYAPYCQRVEECHTLERLLRALARAT